MKWGNSWGDDLYHCGTAGEYERSPDWLAMYNGSGDEHGHDDWVLVLYTAWRDDQSGWYYMNRCLNRLDITEFKDSGDALDFAIMGIKPISQIASPTMDQSLVAVACQAGDAITNADYQLSRFEDDPFWDHDAKMEEYEYEIGRWYYYKLNATGLAALTGYSFDVGFRFSGDVNETEPSHDTPIDICRFEFDWRLYINEMPRAMSMIVEGIECDPEVCGEEIGGAGLFIDGINCMPAGTYMFGF